MKYMIGKYPEMLYCGVGGEDVERLRKDCRTQSRGSIGESHKRHEVQRKISMITFKGYLFFPSLLLDFWWISLLGVWFLGLVIDKPNYINSCFAKLLTFVLHPELEREFTLKGLNTVQISYNYSYYNVKPKEWLIFKFQMLLEKQVLWAKVEIALGYSNIVL